MKKYILSLLALILAIPALAGTDYTKAMGDSAYAERDYERAIEIYSALQQESNSVALCYNLGNCYYRMDDIGHAVLWFERAYRLNPEDQDVIHNLQFVRQRTADKIVATEDLFIKRWYQRFTGMLGVTGWAVFSWIFFAIAFAMLGLYFFSGRMSLRKTGFFGFVACLVLVVLGNLCAMAQRTRNNSHDEAVVMQPSVVVKSSPDAGSTDLFIIHEGTKFSIKDDSMREWAEIHLANGKEGWIPKKDYEQI